MTYDLRNLLLILAVALGLLQVQSQLLSKAPKSQKLRALASRSLEANCVVEDANKLDCGFLGVTEQACIDSGCCWEEAPSGSWAPWCFREKSAGTCFVLHPSIETPFSASELDQMRVYYLNNINIEGKGGVVAAPDLDTPGGSYVYHWMRDGALTMKSLQDNDSGVNMSADTETKMKAYVQWVLNAQALNPLNGVDVRIEPKFMLPDGELFTDPWCRPQNDGPGLQAISLIQFADYLLDRNAAGDYEYVQSYLWTHTESGNDLYHGGAIYYDLDYVLTGFTANTCDLWEEVMSTNYFWNRVTMKKALFKGSKFALRMGDSEASERYYNAMVKLNSTLYKDHWNGIYVYQDKNRAMDSAVILGFSDGYDADMDDLYSPVSFEVASTVNQYNNLFCSEYNVNIDDSTQSVSGVLYGRYAGDIYAGGNPWVLLTAALSQLLYRAAIYVLEPPPGSWSYPLSSEAAAMWQSALNYPNPLPTDSVSLAELFVRAGDGVLLRLRSHVSEGYNWQLYEQLDRNTGAQMSAANLTWSYAEVLNAMNKRDEYIALVSDANV